MAFIERLEQRINSVNSRLCIGLDPDPHKLPSHLSQDVSGIFEFNKAIIDATHDLACAYKPNIAFYEVMGSEGWDLLEETVNHIPDEIITIADAKRGDIGNTASQYAKTFFETYKFDAVTVNPYMGMDTISPYVEYLDNGVIVLALTSNSGAKDFQYMTSDDVSLFEQVSKSVTEQHKKTKNCMLVVGATQSNDIKRVREQSPELYFLVPGIGAQGGSVQDVIDHAGDKVIINSSRQIIYASDQQDFAEAAREQAQKLMNEINTAIQK